MAPRHENFPNLIGKEKETVNLGALKRDVVVFFTTLLSDFANDS